MAGFKQWARTGFAFTASVLGQEALAQTQKAITPTDDHKPTLTLLAQAKPQLTPEQQSRAEAEYQKNHPEEFKPQPSPSKLSSAVKANILNYFNEAEDASKAINPGASQATIKQSARATMDPLIFATSLIADAYGITAPVNGSTVGSRQEGIGGPFSPGNVPNEADRTIANAAYGALREFRSQQNYNQPDGKHYDNPPRPYDPQKLRESMTRAREEIQRVTGSGANPGTDPGWTGARRQVERDSQRQQRGGRNDDAQVHYEAPRNNTNQATLGLNNSLVGMTGGKSQGQARVAGQ